MSTQDPIGETLTRLVSMVRCIHLKQSILAIEAEPKLNFWRLISGAMTDIAVTDWCILFGADSQEAHWKKIVPQDQHIQFRTDLLNYLDIDEESWAVYRNELKDYRDKYFAHFGNRSLIDKFPHFSKAVLSAEFYYSWLRSNALIEAKLPQNLHEYGERFASFSQEIAQKAMAATKNIEEQVF